MKNNFLLSICFLLALFVASCQENVNQDFNPKNKVKDESRGRRACGTSYRFLYPDNGFGYNGNGCVSYYITRGQTRQFKVAVSNTVNYNQILKLRVTFPNQASTFLYTVASTTAGTTSVVYPDPAVSNGAYIEWNIPAMAPFTTYELVLNVRGTTNPSGAENGVSLVMLQPCGPVQDTSCDADENLHLVLVN